MSSLHGSRAAAAYHIEPVLSKPFAHHGYVGKHRVGAQDGMSAHDADTLSGVMCFQELHECQMYSVVVHGTGHGFVHVQGYLPLL